MEMIGQPLPSDRGFQGASMVNLAAGKETSWKTAIFAERGSMMIRTAQHKLIKNQEREIQEDAGEYELYNLVNDPGENVNLVDDPACASLAAELKARLQAWQKDCPPLPTIKGLSTTQGGPPAEGQVKTRRQQLRLRPNKKE
jgi:arylsulfatase A-like enzyme